MKLGRGRAGLLFRTTARRVIRKFEVPRRIRMTKTRAEEYIFSEYEP
jgi:hypothetical protein